MGPQVRSAVRWTTEDGRRHTGQALVRPDSQAGSRTTIWLDDEGALRDAPVDPARAQAVACGSLATARTALVAGSGWTLSRVCLNRRRTVVLDREWERVGPEWGTATHGRTGAVQVGDSRTQGSSGDSERRHGHQLLQSGSM